MWQSLIIKQMVPRKTLKVKTYVYIGIGLLVAMFLTSNVARATTKHDENTNEM